MNRTESRFDLLMDEAWPALARVVADGWVYRHAGGVTKRANSVLPLGGCVDLPRAVEKAERFYAGLRLPCVFSIGPGATSGLDAELDRRGYRLVDPTLVMTAPVAKAVPGVEVEAEPSERWLRTWWRVDGGRHGHGGEVPERVWAERVLTGVPAGYVFLDEGAVGRGVPQGEWLGIYCMAVEPHARRRGHGASVLRALLGWGSERGAGYAYLLVTESNAGARALYEREGFTVAGRYHYRVGP